MRVDTVFCDDIRAEASGKQILIGVYPNDLMAHVSPAHIRLSLWVKVSDAPGPLENVAIELTTDDGANKIEVEGVILDPNVSSSTVFALQGFPIVLSSDTVLRAFLKIKDKEPINIGEMAVRFEASNSSSKI